MALLVAILPMHQKYWRLPTSGTRSRRLVCECGTLPRGCRCWASRRDRTSPSVRPIAWNGAWGAVQPLPPLGPLILVYLSSLHVDTIIRYLADFACVYRSVISVALHTNSNRSNMLFILKRVQVHRTMPNRHCIDDCVWLTDWPMLFFSRPPASCAVPSLSNCSRSWLRHCPRSSTSSTSTRTSRPSPMATPNWLQPRSAPTDNNIRFRSRSPHSFLLLCCLIRQASGADWGQDPAVQ